MNVFEMLPCHDPVITILSRRVHQQNFLPIHLRNLILCPDPSNAFWPNCSIDAAFKISNTLTSSPNLCRYQFLNSIDINEFTPSAAGDCEISSSSSRRSMKLNNVRPISRTRKSALEDSDRRGLRRQKRGTVKDLRSL